MVTQGGSGLEGRACGHLCSGWLGRSWQACSGISFGLPSLTIFFQGKDSLCLLALSSGRGVLQPLHLCREILCLRSPQLLPSPAPAAPSTPYPLEPPLSLLALTHEAVTPCRLCTFTQRLPWHRGSFSLLR